jgi:hypothetical protein
VTYHAEDIAGNVETPPPPVTVRIDRQAPSIVVTNPVDGAVYAQGQSVLAAYGCTDATSGVATCVGSVPSGSPINTSLPGPKTFTVTSTDVAGNAAAPVTISYTVESSADTTPPTVVATATPAPNSDGWNNTNVTVTLTATDNAGGSGVKSITYAVVGPQVTLPRTVNAATTSLTLSAEGTSFVIYVATDKAGNIASPKLQTVRIDKKKPTISGMPSAKCTINPPNGKLVQIANVTADDALSGVATGFPTVTVTSNEPTNPGDIVITGGVVKVAATRLSSGTGRVYTVTATATDNAGNTLVATGSCTVKK